MLVPPYSRKGETLAIRTVLIDQREPDTITSLRFGGAPTMVTLLDAGDVLVNTDDDCLLVIERKTGSDFLNTLRDDRLFGQVGKLRQVSPWAYLVIAGQLQPGANGKCYCDGYETGWAWGSVQGALVTCQELGATVVVAGSEVEFESAVIQLSERSRGSVRVAPPRDLTITGEAENLLCSLPGIGPEKARSLLDYTGSGAAALSYLSMLDLAGKGAPGIGESNKRKVRRALGLEGVQILAVLDAADTNLIRPIAFLNEKVEVG